jgi:hypothetical protein
MRFLDSNGEAESLRQETKFMMQQAIARELEKSIRHDVKVERRKRKRRNAAFPVANHNVRLSLGSYSKEDVDAVAEVLRMVSTYDLPSLDREISSLGHDLCNFDPSAKHKFYTIGSFSRNAFSVLWALLCGVIDAVAVKKSQSIPESFKQKTGLNPVRIYSALLKWLAEQQSCTKTKTERGSLQNGHSSVIVASLLFIRSSFGHVQTSLDQLRIIVAIVSDYALVACQVLRSSSPPRNHQDERRYAVSIVFAIASLLARITGAIPKTCPSDILQVSPPEISIN